MDAPIEGKPRAFHLWLPERVPLVKGIFLFTWYGCYESYSADPDLRSLARELGCAVVASQERLGVPHDDPARVLDALRGLAGLSGHPEIANAPLFVFGHSNSTHDMGRFARGVPERIICWVAMKSAFGAQFSMPELYQVPGIVISGENDREYFQDQLATVKRLRREHAALTHMIVEAGGGHWPEGKKTYTIMQAFLKTMFYLRVPANSDATMAPVRLTRMVESGGWLGENLDGVRVRQPDFKWKWERPVDARRLLEIAPYDRFPGDNSQASWLPNGDYARKWQRFCRKGVVEDWAKMPPGFVENWRRMRPSSGMDGLESELLASHVRRLASARAYRPVLEELREIASDAGKPDEAAEARRIVEHVGALGRERLAQAARLEETHPPSALQAYRDISKRFALTETGEAARERLGSKSLRAEASAWLRLEAMRKAEASMKDVPGSKSSAADRKFSVVNGRQLQALLKLARNIFKRYPDTRAAAAAREMLARYGIPVRSRSGPSRERD